jgi:hypothetical protein
MKENCEYIKQSQTAAGGGPTVWGLNRRLTTSQYKSSMSQNVTHNLEFVQTLVNMIINLLVPRKAT